MNFGLKATGLALAIAAALGASACGRSESKVATARSVYASVDDCATSGKLSYDKCSEAIERAIAQHEKSMTKHKRMQACEDVEGPDRCERTRDGDFRARPSAYLFAVSSSVNATALYAGLKGAHVFRGQDGATYDPENPGAVEFSKAAAKRATSFAAAGKQRRG